MYAGLILMEGDGVAADPKAAMALIGDSAKAPCGQGQYHLGKLGLDGRIPGLGPEEALMWLARATLWRDNDTRGL